MRMVSIMWHELFARRVLLGAALVVGGLAFFATAVLGGSPQNDAYTGAAISWGVGLAFAVVIAAALGVETMSQGQTPGRVSFYFGLPVHALWIWVATAVPALVIIALCGVVAIGPTWAIQGTRAVREAMPLADELGALSISAAARPWVLATIPILAFFVAQALTVMLARRSALVLVDAAAGAIYAAVLWSGIANLLAMDAGRDLLRGLGPTVSVSIVALIASCAAAVAGGRTHHVRAHRALVVTLWPLALVAAFIFARYATWVLSPRPADLLTVRDAKVSPRGSWFAVGGQARGRLAHMPALMVEAVSGRHFSLGSMRGFALPPVLFTQDGRTVFWVESHRHLGSTENRLMRRVLDDSSAPPARPLWLGRQTGQLWKSSMALSPDGAAVAMVLNKAVRIFLTTAKRSVSTGKLPEDAAFWWLHFPTPDTLRVAWCRGQATDDDTGASLPVKLHLALLSVGSTTLVETGAIGGFQGFVPQFDANWDRVLFTSRHGSLVRRDVFDARSGFHLTAVDSGPAHSSLPGAALLSDGRVCRGITRGGVALALVSGVNEPEFAIPLGEGAAVSVVEEAAPGLVVAAVADSKGVAISYVIDVTRRTARALGEGAFPESYARTPLSVAADPHHPPLSLLVDHTDSLRVVDTLTGHVHMSLQARLRHRGARILRPPR